jgi:hypothetical protein
MKSKKNNVEPMERNREIVGGYYNIPPEINALLHEIAAPKSSETIFRIGLEETGSKSPSVVDPLTQGIAMLDVFLERNKLLDEKKYDVILCAPYFGIPTPERRRPSEEIWVEWGIKHLDKGGRLLIIVPMGLLSNYSQGFIRQFILEQANLEAIVELPTGWGSGVSASVLYITNTDKPSNRVRMVQLSKTLSLPINEIGKLVRGDVSKQLFAEDGKYFDVQRSELDYSRLDAKYYDPTYKISPPGSDYASVKLKDLTTIRSGDRFEAEKIESTGIPFIQVKNITENMEIDVRDTRKIKPEVAIHNRSFCKSGDVLISTAGTVGKVAVVPDNMEVCIATSLRQLRIKNKAEILPEYLALFLRSDLAKKQMERMTSGSVINVLSTPNLENITIYIPTIEKQQQIVSSYHFELQEAQKRLFRFFPNFDKVLISESTAPLPENKGESASTVPFSTLASTQFPYPIARAYSLFVHSSNESGANQVKRLFLASEAAVYYLYGILASEYLTRQKPYDQELNSLLITSIRDFSIDKRIKFINKVVKKASSEEWTLFIPDINEVAFHFCSEIHNNVRNKYSHNETSDAWCKKQVKDYSPKLEMLLKSLLPLTDYRLVEVTDIQREAGRWQYNMKLMMGNNYLFSPQVVDLDDPIAMDTKKVTLLDEDNNALELHPYYQFQAWESTGYQSHLCFVKQANLEKNTLKLESLEGSGEIEMDMSIQFSNTLSQLLANEK